MNMVILVPADGCAADDARPLEVSMATDDFEYICMHHVTKFKMADEI